MVYDRRPSSRVAVAVCVPLAPLTFSGLVVPSSSVHHIQEVQMSLCHVLWALTQEAAQGLMVEYQERVAQPL